MKIIKIVGIGIVAIIVMAILVVGYLGFVPGVSDIMGTNKPRDLGVVKFSEANYASGLAKVPGASVLNPEYLCVTCAYTSTGSVPVNTAFSEEEFTSMINKRNSTVGPLRDSQFKFNPDGTVEASGLLIDPRITGPIYIKARIDSASGRSGTLVVDYAEMGRLPLPPDQLKIAQDIVNDSVRDTFTNNPGLSVNSISIADGKINFDGTLPKDAVGNPSVVPKQYN